MGNKVIAVLSCQFIWTETEQQDYKQSHYSADDTNKCQGSPAEGLVCLELFGDVLQEQRTGITSL